MIIDIYVSFQVTSGSLRSIASLQKLEGLAMSGCSLVGDLGLHFLGNGCPSLRVISFLINNVVYFFTFCSFIRRFTCQIHSIVLVKM